MSGGSGANNSWTILSSEEPVAETLRPLAEGTEQNEENQTSTSGSGENNQPANAAEGPALLDDTVSEEKPAELSEASEPTAVTEAPISSALEASGSSVHEVGQTEGSSEGPAELSPDPDSSSESYTCVTSSPDEPPASLLSTETVGSAAFAPDEEKLNRDETLHRHLNGEELHLEGEESERQRSADLGKQADSPEDSEAGEKTGEEGEPEVRRRRSLLAALERVGRREEEEEDEDFQVPQREEDSGFSVNKCILGAVILLGLGTIFFSESDYGPADVKGAEVPGKQEWLNPEAPPPPVDADSSQLLNKLAEGSQQISVLQAQLQAQKEELKVAKGQAAEGAKERRHWEEVEKENSRLKTQMASLPVLQKENERMKKDLESVPALQKELETLRSTVTELKLSSAAEQAAHVKPTTSPPTGQLEDSRQAKKPWDDQKEKKKKVKYDMGEKKEWKEKSAWKGEDKKERKDGGKKEKREQGTFEKEGKHKRQNDEAKQWKKEKMSRGDEGKPWKNREGKKEWIGKGEKKEWKEEKERKKVKHEKVNEGKQWKGGKDHGERHKGKDEWKGEKEWKKVKDGYKESGKEKWEKKDWKEKGEKKEWKKESEWKDKGKGERKHFEGGKNHGKERSGKDERKQWNEQEWSRNGKHDKEWKRKDEKEEEWKRGKQKEKKHNGDGKKEKWEKSDKFTGHHVHGEDHLYADGKQPHSHRKPSLDQPEYWQQRKDRLQRNPKPPQHCSSLETCAQAERLRPVALPDFEAVLQTYLAKAEEAGVDESKREELRKLAAEFFKDGVFVHDQMSFQEFAEDVGDILEDMVEGDEEDSAIEEEMEAFEREVMETFSIPGEKEERIKSEWRKEGERGRG
ncbi:pre-B-cell leukemia homeobox interacting protein 1b isoform X3 [Acanthochromis polyacanthus]|uniref:pre-B-cell leukemia homeobox interacting protein 1b isoform X3 n=1 Tax=Acanthochromis polyacanthus TaxID=80966 RepID=UPI0022349E4E|nr:pre-B-cell leukemia homeobox interacting protein 1b isoform X3 [Acanthochromis polyacanthus]